MFAARRLRLTGSVISGVGKILCLRIRLTADFDKAFLLTGPSFRTLRSLGLPNKLSSITNLLLGLELAHNFSWMVVLLHGNANHRLKRVGSIVAGIVQVCGANGQRSKQFFQSRRLRLRYSGQSLRVDLALHMLGREVQFLEVIGIVLEVVSDEHDEGRDIRDLRVETGSLMNATWIPEDTIHDTASVAKRNESTFSKIESVLAALDKFPVDILKVFVWAQV